VAQAHLADPERWWDDLLTRSARAPAFRMVRDGATLPRTQLCRSAGVGHQRLDDLIEPNRVLEAYDEGASLVLQGLQHSDPAMARLSTNLALELDQPVQLNAYLSPAAARGLDLHFDYHDVIVVQLSGTKAWRIWAPLVRSLLPQKRGPGIAKPGWDEVGEPVIDVVVQPGDALVIPRGHPHAASTIDDESAHLTIGIMSLTWQALIGNRLRDTVGGSSLSATAAPTILTTKGVGLRRWPPWPRTSTSAPCCAPTGSKCGGANRAPVCGPEEPRGIWNDRCTSPPDRCCGWTRNAPPPSRRWRCSSGTGR
jgi:hypothetical protein